MQMIVYLILMSTHIVKMALQILKHHFTLAIFVRKVLKVWGKSWNTIKVFIPAVSNTVSSFWRMHAFMVIIAGIFIVNHSENQNPVLNVIFVKRNLELKIFSENTWSYNIFNLCQNVKMKFIVDLERKNVGLSTKKIEIAYENAK